MRVLLQDWIILRKTGVAGALPGFKLQGLVGKGN